MRIWDLSPLSGGQFIQQARIGVARPWEERHGVWRRQDEVALKGGGLCGAGTGAARAKALRSGTGGREERGPWRDPRLVLSEAGATGGFRVEEGWGLRREMMGLRTGSEGGGWGTLGLWEGTGRGRCRVSLAAALWASGCLSCLRASVPRRPKHRAHRRLSWERWRRPGVAPAGRGVVSPGYGNESCQGPVVVLAAESPQAARPPRAPTQRQSSRDSPLGRAAQATAGWWAAPCGHRGQTRWLQAPRLRPRLS